MAPPVGGYIAWYDATQISGPADGAVLSTWPDLSGNSRDLNNHAGSPTFYKTTSAKLINGNQTVYFGGVSDRMWTTATYNQAQPITVFLVLRTDAVSVNGSFCGQGSNHIVVLQASGNAWCAYSGNIINGGGVTLGVHYVTAQFNSTSSLVRVDGTQVASGDTGSAGLATGIGGFVVGDDSTSVDQPFKGLIGELIIYPSALSVPNMQSVESYLTTKWSSAPGGSGTATLPLGPLTLTSTSITTVVSTSCSVSLGPLTLTSTGTASYPHGSPTLPLGPLTLTSTSINIAVPHITIGPLALTITSSISAGGGQLALASSSNRLAYSTTSHQLERT